MTIPVSGKATYVTYESSIGHIDLEALITESNGEGRTGPLQDSQSPLLPAQKVYERT